MPGIPHHRRTRQTPAFAAELRTTGFIDSIFPHYERNLSSADSDTTRNDSATFGRTRGRFFFNFIASDDLRGVLGIELDAIWGLPREDAAGAGCYEIPDDGLFLNSQCGFGQNTDINNFQLKHLYVDFRIPQLPIGNRWQLGGLPIVATPLRTQIVFNGDYGGGTGRLTFTDRAALWMFYAQREEDVWRFRGADSIGEDYATGARLELRPIEGLDLHLVGVYGHQQAPFGPAFRSSTGTPFDGIANDFVNVTDENRFYLGFDARYRIGTTSIEPFFFYNLGTRNFCAPGSLINSTGTETLIPCTSPVGSRSSTDFNAFVGRLLVSHTTGPWLFQAQYAYASGQDANDDINNRGVGRRADAKSYRMEGRDGSPIWQEWFEIMGRSEVDGTSLRTFRRMGEIGHLDRFGWQVLAGAVEYQAADNLILEGAVGGFWTAKKTACPAVLVSATTGLCGGPRNSSGEPALNFTGNSRYVGFEIAAGIRYSVMPGLTWTPRLAYADYGSAVAANNRKATDAWSFSNRLIYIF